MVLNVERSGNRSVQGLPLPPGFRFYPTDEELVWHYLRKKADSECFEIPIIADVDLYKFDPWDLPDMALFGEKEWFFFTPRDRKYPNGKRPNRAAASGFWKATGTDKAIYKAGDKVGVKKSLVFYEGRAPKGVKTNWIMHEYRLIEGVAPFAHHHRRGSLRLDDWVLCRIYEKSTHAQRAGHDGESVWASQLPEISDAGLMEGMLAAADTNSEDGSLTTTSLPMMNVVPGGGAGSTSAALTNAWETQLQAMASTSRGPTLLDKTRFVQQLEASQSQLHMAPSVVAQFPSRSWNSTYADLRESCFNPMATMIRSPISDDESQSTFQYEMEPSLCAPAPLHNNNILSLPRIPDNFTFSYGGDYN